MQAAANGQRSLCGCLLPTHTVGAINLKALQVTLLLVLWELRISLCWVCSQGISGRCLANPKYDKHKHKTQSADRESRDQLLHAIALYGVSLLAQLKVLTIERLHRICRCELE